MLTDWREAVPRSQESVRYFCVVAVGLLVLLGVAAPAARPGDLTRAETTIHSQTPIGNASADRVLVSYAFQVHSCTTPSYIHAYIPACLLPAD